MSRRTWILRKLECVVDASHRWEQLIGPERPAVCPTCGAHGERAVIAAASATVVDDALPGGARFIENIAHDPIYVETKSEYRALLNAHGLRQSVRHIGVPGSDKSPITTSWNLPPTQDPRPFAMLSPDEQIERRKEAAIRLGMTVEELESYDRPTESSRIQFTETPRSATWFTPDRG